MQHGSAKSRSPMQETWQAYRQQYSPRGGPAPIPLRSWITPPWKDRSEQCLDIEQSQVIDFLAREQRQGTAILYTDASVRNRVSGCAAVIASGQGLIRTVYQDTVGWATTCPILSAEIHAIKQAIDYIVPVRSWSYHHYIIASDSQDAIRAFKKGNTATKDREALQGLIASFDEAERYRVNIRLLWVPAHQGVLGNELAHTAAQGMTNPGSRPTSDLTARIREHRATRNLVAKEAQRRAMEKQREKGLGTWGQYTQRLDAALPGKHTLKLYGSLDSDQAAVLVQAPVHEFEEPWGFRARMTTLKLLLERLDLTRYHDAFVDEGFDTWETLMDITESDLEALGVKLGHRRKLQRAIFESSQDRTPLSLFLRSGSRDESAGHDEIKKTQPPQLQQQTSNGSQDQDAAKIRDQLRGQELSFTEIAKLVGERWQELQAHEKEPCEREAQALKDTYYSELRKYKKTSQYRQYQDYLVEFKTKHPGDTGQQQQGSDQKKSKLRQEASGQSRIYDDSVVDGEEGADGMDGVDGDGGMDGVDSTYNQPPSPSDKARASTIHNSPSNLERYRLFPIPRVPLEPAPSSSYSTWQSNQSSCPHASLHRYTTKSTLSSDQDSRSLAFSPPAPTTALTTAPTTDPATSLTNAPVPVAASAPTPLRSTLHPGAPKKPAPITNTILPSIDSSNSIAPRNPSDTPLLNWPLYTTLPPLDSTAMSQHSTPDSHYSSPSMHQITQPGPSLRSSPWPSIQDPANTNLQNKASLSTLLRATEHVERDYKNRSADFTHKK
ncbi:hypothetical protein KCV03_g9981, partial [Aureobasidium melanogenum]